MGLIINKFSCYDMKKSQCYQTIEGSDHYTSIRGLILDATFSKHTSAFHFPGVN